jgi:hypothetical protein
LFVKKGKAGNCLSFFYAEFLRMIMLDGYCIIRVKMTGIRNIGGKTQGCAALTAKHESFNPFPGSAPMALGTRKKIIPPVHPVSRDGTKVRHISAGQFQRVYFLPSTLT